LSAFDNKSLHHYQGFCNSYASISSDVKPYSTQIPACNNYINLRPIVCNQQPQISQKASLASEKKNISFFEKIRHKFVNIFNNNNSKQSSLPIESVKLKHNIIPLNQNNFYTTPNNLRNNTDINNITNSVYSSSNSYPNNPSIYSTHASFHAQPIYYQNLNKYIF
jgi:hypothetical protein